MGEGGEGVLCSSFQFYHWVLCTSVPWCTLMWLFVPWCNLVLLQYHLPKAHSHLQKDGEGLSFRGATTSIPIAPHSKISCTTSVPYIAYIIGYSYACPMYTTWKWVPLPYLTYNTVKSYAQKLPALKATGFSVGNEALLLCFQWVQHTLPILPFLYHWLT